MPAHDIKLLDNVDVFSSTLSSCQTGHGREAHLLGHLNGAHRLQRHHSTSAKSNARVVAVHRTATHSYLNATAAITCATYAGRRAFMRFFPAACFFSSFFLRETSPP